MRTTEKLGLILMMLSVTACAPVVYDANYGAPARDTYVYASFEQPVYYNETAYRPIEVTLYADNNYMGVYFQPIHLVIYDGQYVEIPVRDRRGRDAKIYAHYHQNNLHFDSDRNDHGINGSSRFNYDNRWENGHKYSNINAGQDYDLTGLQMQIRNAPAVSEHRENMVPEKNDRSNRASESKNKASIKQNVPAISKDNQARKVVENRNNRPLERQATDSIGKTVRKVEKRQGNSLIYNNNSENEQLKPGKTTTKRPEIVKKTINNEQSHQVSAKIATSMEKEKTVNRSPVQKIIVKEIDKNERNSTETEKISGVLKVKEIKKENEAAARAQRQEGSPSQDMRFAEKHEVDDVTSQDNANHEGQQGWTKAMDKNRGKSKKNNLVLNEAD